MLFCLLIAVSGEKGITSSAQSSAAVPALATSDQAGALQPKQPPRATDHEKAQEKQVHTPCKRLRMASPVRQGCISMGQGSLSLLTSQGTS